MRPVPPCWGHGPLSITLARSDASGQLARRAYAEKLLPQPHPPVAFGFLKVKPEPCIEVT